MFGRKKMIPAGIAAMGILIAAMAFVGGCGTQNTDQNDQTNVSVEVSAGVENTQADTDVVCYIDGDAVSVEEYVLLAENHKNDILMRYTTEQVNQPDFWEQEIDGKVPAEQLETIISQDLTENYAIKHLAVEWKVTEDYTFEDLKAQMEEKNDAQSDRADTTDSYGLTEYDISKYYSYWYSNLQTKLINQMIGNSKDYSNAQDVEAYITEKAEKSVIRPGGASATNVILETFAQ